MSLEVGACHNMHKSLQTVGNQRKELCQDHSEVQHREHNGKEALPNAKLFKVGQLNGEKDHNPENIDDQHCNQCAVAQFFKILPKLVSVVSSCLRSCLEDSTHHLIPEFLLTANQFCLRCIVNGGSSLCNANLICVNKQSNTAYVTFSTQSILRS